MYSSTVHLPAAVHACIISRLDFRSRCAVASVNKLYHALVASAAGHEGSTWSDSDDEEQLVDELDVDMRLVEEYAEEGPDPLYKLACCEACPATRFARSLGILIQSSGLRFLRSMKQLTRLELLDPSPYLGQNQLCDQPAAAVSSLATLEHLRSLRITVASPLVDLSGLPGGLQQLELEWFAAVSQQQLHTMCGQLAAAAGRLPKLSRLTLAAELDPLISKSSSDAGSGLNQLSSLTQLTSVRILRFQQPTPANADSPCHQGYTRVPAVLGQLPQLKRAEVHLCSGHKAQLAPLQHAEEICLHLTLEREETTPFNRLPSSITLLTGLTELVLTSAEFQPDAAPPAAAAAAAARGGGSGPGGSSVSRQPSSAALAAAAAAGMGDIPGTASSSSSSAGAPVFDLTPLRHCPALKRLLVELHGSPGRLHDVRGLQQLVSLQELVLLFKCPALSSLRKLLLGSWHPAVTAAAAAEEEQEGLYGSHGSSSTTSSSSGGGAGRGAKRGSKQGFLARLLSCFAGDEGGMEAPASHSQAVRPRAVIDTRPYSQRTQLRRNSDGSASGSSEASAAQGRATAHVYISGAEAAAAAAAAGGGSATACWAGEAVPPEDVALCRDIMSCLRSFSPVFAVGVPPAAQRVAVATNSRLLLRAPHNLAKAERVELVAGSVYLQGAHPPAAAGGGGGGAGHGSGVDLHTSSSHHSSSGRPSLSRQGSSLHTSGTGTGDATPASPRGLFGRGWFGSASSNNLLAADAAAGPWKGVVQHQARVAHRHLQLLQGAVTQVQAAGGTCTGSSIKISPAVAPHLHAVRHRLPRQVQPHHHQLSSSIRHWWHAEGGGAGGAAAALVEDATVAHWLQQQSGGGLVLLPPAVYPQLVAGAIAAGASPGAVPGYGPGVPGVPEWLEVDEEGDLVGRDVALPVSVVTRVGVTGYQVVQQLLAEVDQDCFTFFS